jgi:hypothetical protein
VEALIETYQGRTAVYGLTDQPVSLAYDQPAFVNRTNALSLVQSHPETWHIQEIPIMAPTADPVTATVLSAAQVTTAISTIMAVEKHAADLPGATKQQIVVDTVNASVAAAPAVVSLIGSLVALFNAFGWFKHKA